MCGERCQCLGIAVNIEVHRRGHFKKSSHNIGNVRVDGKIPDGGGPEKQSL